MVSLMADGFEPLNSDEDVEEILRLAVRSGSSDPGTLRDRLNATANELGIAPEALAQAEQQWLAGRQREADRMQELEDRRQFKRLQVGGFVSHLGPYLAINAFLAWIDYGKDQKLSWVLWVIFAWGIALVIHLFSLFTTDQDTEKEFQKWRKKRHRASKGS